MALTQLDGTRQLKFSGTLDLQTHKIVNVVDPTSAQDGATKAYVDAVAQGQAPKQSVQAATVGTETFTIATGAVTTINGTTVDGYSAQIGDRILIKDAPATTGAGSAFSTQPANGIYTVTGNTTNLTVARATDMATTNGPAGAYTFAVNGTTNGSNGFVVIVPTSNTGFTYNTSNIKWTEYTGTGDITVDSTIIKTGNQLARAATTGDVVLPSGSNVATIQAGAVTLAKMANLAANSVIANNTGSSAVPIALGLGSAATASTVAYRDTNGNMAVNNLIEGMATTATAAGTTTLTVASKAFQQFTGSTTQTVVLPDATTLLAGQSYTIANRSTGVVTVNANGGGLIQSVAAGAQVTVTVITVATAAGTWDSAYSTPGGGSVVSVSVASANGFTGTSSGGTTPALTIATSITGLLKGNGTAISAATAGTDYLVPSGFITRETPTGTVNGSNTSFSLANTPVAGTESVFLNGMLQEPGSGNDYTISGGTITYLAAPLTGDKIRVNYQK